MRLAISNLAWPPERDEEVARLLRSLGADGIEVAPTRIWPRPLEAGADAIRAYRHFWEDRGFAIVAMQALLFGRPELTIFESSDARRHTLDYLDGICRLGGLLGARALVFGSPRNRSIGSLSPAEVEAIAVPFFRHVGTIARSHGVVVCIEPNPAAYQCDYVTTVAEAARLVDAVGEEGFGLHLDVGELLCNQEPVDQVLAAYALRARHFHISEPFLAAVGTSQGAPHRQIGTALRAGGYDGWVSIEMREAPDVLGAIDGAVRLARACYLGRDDGRRAA
jgi:sugar phosphate isomerase/epimerase